MVGTFYDGHDELYHHAKFREIEQRTPAVGLKIWCFYVCYRQFTVKWQTAGIKIPTHRPKIRFFTPHGRIVAQIYVKLGTRNEESTQNQTLHFYP